MCVQPKDKILTEAVRGCLLTHLNVPGTVSDGNLFVLTLFGSAAERIALIEIVSTEKVFFFF